MPARWIVLRERSRLRWGGDLRRHHVLSALGARDDALDVDGWSPGRIRAALEEVRRRPWQDKPRLAAATMLAPDALHGVEHGAIPFAVDFHDDPVAQHAALGVPPEPAWLADVLDRKRRNLDVFRWHVVPSAELAAIAGLDPSRIVVAGNGSDTDVIRPMPWPDRPAVGFMSGAAAGRGIETLIEAARLVRGAVPELRLLLWLAATGAASEAYLAGLKQVTAGEPWIEYRLAPYDELGEELGRATVQCVPNPAAAYWDAVSPIKLFDAMASGRPVVVTPRTVMRADVERDDAGIVTSGDSPEDLAAPIARLLADEVLARRLGQNGRAAAVERHDWRSISGALAEKLVALAR